MKIYNNVDGQARLAENFADGVNTSDLATVGQIGGGSSIITDLSVGTALQYDSISVNSSGNAIVGSRRAFGGYVRFNNYSLTVSSSPNPQYLYGYQLYNISRYLYNVTAIANSTGLMRADQAGYYLINISLSHFKTSSLVSQITLTLSLRVNGSAYTYEKAVHQFYAGSYCTGTMSISPIVPLSANALVDCQLAISYNSSNFTLYFSSGVFSMVKVRD